MKAKNLKFMDNLAMDRIQEKEEQLKRDRIRLEIAIEEGNKEDIEIYKYRITRAEEYLRVARG